ncbi:hypothetical protein HF086_009096 [Spodoptera exigua]|uniref:Uncharacterized protein n=1 Tax=Spodoptera exigua TaxID=7107 RepID=A0A922MNA5_SPOEX|nr:hypothetical protein HF086_009096 [Spodoptera exigua]
MILYGATTFPALKEKSKTSEREKKSELLNNEYYIRDVDKMQDFLLSCIPCLLVTRYEGVPFDTLHLDYIGPLTKTRKHYILTMIDGFTKADETDKLDEDDDIDKADNPDRADDRMDKTDQTVSHSDIRLKQFELRTSCRKSHGEHVTIDDYLASTMHHDTKIKKPEMITDNNNLKCGVDVVDQMTEKCKRSVSKEDNLMKPFMIVSCDGHIIDAVAPYAPTQTDAEIMTHLFENENGPFRKLFIVFKPEPLR